MVRTRRSPVAAAALFAILAIVPVFGQQNSGALKIVVVAGEDAINIVQQKTAVAPVVEVRDRNDQPVAGAVVRFAIRGGRATFGGPRTLTLTTNAAGRASVATLTPTGTGIVHITATATFQGQTVAVTIAQTNLASAAALGSVAAGPGGTAVTGGGTAGSGGGGLSVTTLAVTGGAAVGGVVAAKQLLGFTTYVGDIVTDHIETRQPPGSPCTQTFRYTGHVTFRMKGDPNVSGKADMERSGTSILTSSTCPGLQLGGTGTWGFGDPDLHGTTDAITFSETEIGAVSTANYVFLGALDNGVITGTLTETTTSATWVGVNVIQITAR